MTALAPLREILEDVLPTVLPCEPGYISGVKICDMIKDCVAASDASIRYHLTQMSRDPNSCVVRRTGGHGYYRRCHDNRDAICAAAYELAAWVAISGINWDVPGIQAALEKMRDADPDRWQKEVTA